MIAAKPETVGQTLIFLLKGQRAYGVAIFEIARRWKEEGHSVSGTFLGNTG